MTDKELLELAAKAAGIEVVWLESSYYGPTMALVEFRSGEGEVTEPWNPLTDDGDALRLAVQLGLCVESHFNGQSYVWLSGLLLWNEFALHEDVIAERLAATRRAIVRAAAEIGRQME